MSKEDNTLPEGLRISLTAYLVSPSTGLEAAVTLGNARRLPVITDSERFLKDVSKDLRNVVNDWRFMTNEEIDAYLSEAEEDGEGGEYD